MLQCLNNIIGVTNSENPCITAGLTPEQLEEIRTTTSGLYLDGLEGGVHMKTVNSVDATKGFYDMAMGSISGATERLEADLLVAVNNKYKKAKNYEGTIGRQSFAVTLGVTGRWQGLRLRASSFSDAMVTVSRILVIINQTAAFNLYVYRNIEGNNAGTLIATFPLSAVANAYSTIIPAVPLQLPFIERGEALEYYFIWSRDETLEAMPKDNAITCTPCEQRGGSALGDFVEAKGIQYDGAANAFTQPLTDNYSHGLVLDVSIKCDTQALFCREYNADDAVAVTMAYATRYKAGELLIEEVLKSPDVNRYTTMAREYLWGKRNHFRKEYDDRVQYLAATLDVSGSDCYLCREVTNQPFHAGILS